MTLNEFKAWLEGYETSFDGAPTVEQYEKIKERLEKVAAPIVTVTQTPPFIGTTILPYTPPRIWQDTITLRNNTAAMNA